MLLSAASAILALGGRLFSGALVSHCCTAPRSRDEQPRVGNWLAKGRALLITVGVTLCPAAMGWDGLLSWAGLAAGPASFTLHRLLHRRHTPTTLETFSSRFPQLLNTCFMF